MYKINLEIFAKGLYEFAICMVESHESKEDAKRTLCFIEGVVARGWQITRWIASSPVFRSADFRVPSDPPLHVCMQFDNVCFYVMCSFDQKHNTHYRWGDLPDDAAARPLVVYGPRERWIVRDGVTWDTADAVRQTAEDLIVMWKCSSHQTRRRLDLW